MKRGHVSFEHTADLGIEAWAEDLSGLLEEVVLGLCELIADLSTITPTEVKHVEVCGFDREELLVTASNEVVFFLDAHGFLSTSLEIEKIYEDDGQIFAVGKIHGATYDRTKHKTFTEIKSATYHDLKIIDEEGGLRVKIVFDV